MKLILTLCLLGVTGVAGAILIPPVVKDPDPTAYLTREQCYRQKWEEHRELVDLPGKGPTWLVGIRHLAECYPVPDGADGH